MAISNADYLMMQNRVNKLFYKEGLPIGGSERKLHEQILAECRSRGWIAIHSRMDRPATTAIGSPDFVILADQGRVLIIEAKSAKGKLTKEQAALRCWAGQLGHTIHLIRSYEEFVMLATVP